MWWNRIIGVVLLLLAAWQLYKGRFSTADDFGHSETFDRSARPIRFWITVVAELILGALFLLGVFDSLLAA